MGVAVLEMLNNVVCVAGGTQIAIQSRRELQYAVLEYIWYTFNYDFD